MSERNEYIQCAYEELERLSLDRQKRLEYETRQKNIRDYNSQMKSARIQGEEIGMQKGKQQAEEQILALGKALQRVGRSEEAIKAMTDEKYLKKLRLNHKFCGISDSSRSSVGSYRIASERNIRHQDIRIPVCEES